MHEKWQDMLPHYINHTLSDAERQALEAHLEHCAECRGIAAEWLALAQAATAEVEALQDDLPPLILPGNSYPISPSPKKPFDSEDKDMLRNHTLSRQPGYTGRLHIPLTLVAALVAVLLFAPIALGLFYTQPTKIPSPVVVMSQATDTEIFRRYIDEVWNEGNTDILGEILTADHVHHDAKLEEAITGIEAMTEYVTHFRAVIPNHTLTIDQINENEGTVWAQLTFTDGDFMATALARADFLEDKIAEIWFDATALMEARNVNFARRWYSVFLSITTTEGMCEWNSSTAYTHNYTGGYYSCSDVRDKVAALVGAIPDLKIEIEDITADGDRVLTHMTWTGTFTDKFSYVVVADPTNGPIAIHGVEILRIENGKITEDWMYFGGDDRGILQAMIENESEKQNIQFATDLKRFMSKPDSADMSIFATPYRHHDMLTSEIVDQDPAVLADWFVQWKAAFPKGKIYVTDTNIIGVGNMVFIWYTFAGKFENPLSLPGYETIQPTGENVNVQGVFVLRIEDHKIAELWRYEANPILWELARSTD